jgi:hypothetical protein
MIRIILIVASLALTISMAQGQDVNVNPRKKNAVYLELFGSAFAKYNITYDRIIYSKQKRNLSAALGAQYLPIRSERMDRVVSITPQINYFYGIKHHFETGLGLAYFAKDDFYFPLRLGYRYQKPEGGFFFKIAFTPHFSGGWVLPWAGIAFGVAY